MSGQMILVFSNFLKKVWPFDLRYLRKIDFVVLSQNNYKEVGPKNGLLARFLKKMSNSW